MRFFFSSRRRHTRFDCDWSSDVCSSDLDDAITMVAGLDEDPADNLLRASVLADLERHADLRRATSRILDRKSTRLNSSHSQISYAVFCLKKKNNNIHVHISASTLRNHAH